MQHTLPDLTQDLARRSGARAFAHLAKAKAARRPGESDLQHVEAAVGRRSKTFELIEKATVTAHSSGGPAALAAMQTLENQFLETNPSPSVLSRLGFVPVPTATRIAIESTPFTAAWVTATSSIPVSAMGLALSDPLTPATIATVFAVTKELARSTTPEAFRLFER